MDLITAIQKIAKQNTYVSYAAKIALSNKINVIKFANEIKEQCAEPGTNKQMLEKTFGKEIIKTILDFTRKEAIKQDFLLMNYCIKNS